MAVTAATGFSDVVPEIVSARPSFLRLAARSCWTLTIALLLGGLFFMPALPGRQRQPAFAEGGSVKTRGLHRVEISSFPKDDAALANWIRTQPGTRQVKIWREGRTLKMEIERNEGYLMLGRTKLESLGYGVSGNVDWYPLWNQSATTPAPAPTKPGPVAPLSGWLLVWMFIATSLGFLCEALIRRSKDAFAGLNLPPLSNGRALVQIRTGLIAGVLLGIATLLYASVFYRNMGQDQLAMMLSSAHLNGPQGAGLLVDMVLVGPIAEELLFRGCIYGLFARHGYVRSGIVFSALMFGMLHLSGRSWPAAVSATLLGLALGGLCRKAGSLLTPITAHVAINGTICLLGSLAIR